MWVQVESKNAKTYIDANGIKSFTGDDIYVWVLEEYFKPQELEIFDEDIYKTKTYYRINRKLEKYNMLQVIYYDEDRNVIKSFSYKNDSDSELYKYPYPILENTVMKNVLNKCIKIIDEPKDKSL